MLKLQEEEKVKKSDDESEDEDKELTTRPPRRPAGRPPQTARTIPTDRQLDAIDKQYDLTVTQGVSGLTNQYLTAMVAKTNYPEQYKKMMKQIDEIHAENCRFERQQREETQRQTREVPEDVLKAIKTQHAKAIKDEHRLNPSFKKDYNIENEKHKYYDNLSPLLWIKEYRITLNSS